MNSKQDKLQQEFINKGLEFFKTKKRGYFDIAMRFGKTKVVIEMMKKLDLDMVLIAYPDNKLKDVWKNEMEKWGYVKVDLGIGHKNPPFPEIHFTNFSSLHKYTNFEPCLFIIDEFHSASDNERDYCHQIMTNSEETKTLALSGTVSKETHEEWGIPCIGKYTTEQGIDDGILADYQITVHLVELDNKILTKNKAGKLLTEKKKYENYSFVISKMQQGGQNSMFLALSRNRLSLSSIGKMTYLKALLSKLREKRVIVFTGLTEVADTIGIPSYHNKSPNNSGYLNFFSGKSNHLALAQMGKMGVSYPNLDSVILMNFTYNAEESSQILNRALLLDYKGKVADLHILCLNEKPELKKIKESLSMLDQNKIKYL